MRPIADKVLKKFQYSLPWTYPAEIKKLILQGSTVLDVGCGDGHLMAWINYDNKLKVEGTDINGKDLQIARKRKCFTNNKQSVFQIIYKVDLREPLPFKKKFDVVLSSQVVEHLKKEDALELIKKMEKLAQKRIIVATINGFFQFDHRRPGKYDVHLSSWSPKEFSKMGYKVSTNGLKVVYKPGGLKDLFPTLNKIFFLISYLSTPILRFFHQPGLLLIAYKDI